MVKPCIGCGKPHSPDEPCADGTQWAVYKVKCRICGHNQVSILPIKPGGEEPYSFECGNCGNDSGDIEEGEGDECIS